MKKQTVSRRNSIKSIGASGVSLIALSGSAESSGSKPKQINTKKPADYREKIFNKVFSTPLIDTHEHIIEEKGRFIGNKHPHVRSDDWSMVLSHYLDSDLRVAGMTEKEYKDFFSGDGDPLQKWKIIEPYWPYVKNTGYGLAVTITLKELYGVDELSSNTVGIIQKGYENVRKPGFYKYILRDICNIESCQVNNLEGKTFIESSMPDLLMQDISIVGMFSVSDFKSLSEPSGINVTNISDWYRVIDWWFDKYGDKATAVKSQNAYARDINYYDVPAETAGKIFKNKIENRQITEQEQKMLEDHLFWYSVKKATACNLPVKLHTGYYAGFGYMPLSRLINNPGSATDLCKNAPDTRFVFMHICYPYYEEMIAAAKHWPNAYIDMCWSWILNPLAAKDFLKKYIVTAPLNKILTFGGDYIPVEPVTGHAKIARNGIAQALCELVDENLISVDDAIESTDIIMNRNARKIFRLS